MYVKTPRARVWVPSSADTPFIPKRQAREHRPPAQTLEARKAFEGKLGRFIAIRRIPSSTPGEPDVLMVAVANKAPSEKGPAWVRAEAAITSREVAQWVREGF